MPGEIDLSRVLAIENPLDRHHNKIKINYVTKIEKRKSSDLVCYCLPALKGKAANDIIKVTPNFNLYL